MKRYFAEIAYNGTRFSGWQVQPGVETIQETIEKALTTMLRTRIWVTGCGRTDAGVHASYYVIHFDYDGEFPEHFLFRLNNFINADICFYSIKPVAADAHARFDAVQRSYRYVMGLEKNPFQQETAWYYIMWHRLDVAKMQETAKVLLEFDDFETLSKTGGSAKTSLCRMDSAEWKYSPDGKQLHFEVSANRFLRGMVRLIVGACVQVGLGNASVESFREAVARKGKAKFALSVPPQGLFLTDIKYPYTF